MAFRTRNRTFRKLYSAGKLLLPVLWVCLFVIVLHDTSLRSGPTSVTFLPTKLVSTKGSVKTVRPTVSFSNEDDDRKAFGLQEYQILNRMSVGLEDKYSKKDKEYVTTKNNAKKRPKDCRLYPDILIVGFEKCGTMTLRSYLGTHPQIYITNSNLSIPYFNSVNYVSLETFTKNMSCTPAGKLRLEKISTYGLAVNAYKTLPNIKLLAMVREPVERAMSHHVHRIARSKEISHDFDAVIESLLEGDTDGQKTVKTSVLFRQSTYIDRLQQWLQTYGRDKILVVDGDKFIKHPALELNKIEKFLSISPYFTKDHFVFNPVKRFYCLKSARNDTTGCMNGNKGRPHPEMSEVTRKRLQDYFKPFNEKFFLAVGQNFSWN